MKRFLPLLLTLTILAGTRAGAAEATAQVEALFQAVQKDLTKYRRDSITKALQLDAQEAVRFWPIYEQYERALADSKLRRMTVIAEYAQVRREGTFDETTARTMMENYFAEQRKQLDALEEYGKKIEVALGAVRAAQFIQVESLNNDLIDYGFASNLPLVGSQPDENEEPESPEPAE